MNRLFAFLLITSVFVSCTDKKKEKEETTTSEVETVVEDSVVTDSVSIEEVSVEATEGLSPVAAPEVTTTEEVVKE